jgi:hypothetical protein
MKSLFYYSVSFYEENFYFLNLMKVVDAGIVMVRTGVTRGRIIRYEV